MTPAEERALHDRDHAAWLAYVSPNMAARLDATPNAELSTTWERIPRDYQIAVWDRMNEIQRERIRNARRKAA
jgi:hypothetical protein